MTGSLPAQKVGMGDGLLFDRIGSDAQFFSLAVHKRK